MKILGFNFEKISIEKFLQKDQIKKELNINSNINIDSLNALKQNILKTKEDILGIKFTYIIDYSPNIAKLEFKGTLILSLDSKKIKNILKKWESKELSEDFRADIYNIILKKSNIKALQLEEELNIPSHIQLPFIKK